MIVSDSLLYLVLQVFFDKKLIRAIALASSELFKTLTYLFFLLPK